MSGSCVCVFGFIFCASHELRVFFELFFDTGVGEAFDFAENLHEFLSGDSLSFDQVISDLVEDVTVFGKHLLSFFELGLFEHLHDFMVNLGGCFVTAV